MMNEELYKQMSSFEKDEWGRDLFKCILRNKFKDTFFAFLSAEKFTTYDLSMRVFGNQIVRTYDAEIKVRFGRMANHKSAIIDKDKYEALRCTHNRPLFVVIWIYDRIMQFYDISSLNNLEGLRIKCRCSNNTERKRYKDVLFLPYGQAQQIAF